ncbi:MAG: ABC transporter ATP-binding protein [Deltaproteobacteria bacterium]|nr:ABC transporter ATP-binding protein [Deltaproteobacteria bacterium]
MSTVITVENLGKKYLLQHQSGQQPYVALRDVIADTCRTFGRKLVSPFVRHSQSPVSSPQSPTSEEFWALKDVSFEVKQGDRIGIIGRNGAGKSTLLKILSRITEPTTGSVRIKGRVASLLEVGTGFHPELTGRENIYLNGAILGMSRAEIRKKFDEIVDFAEIEKFLDTPVKRYSSGMYVRLAFAVAAHLEPEILVVDEVLAVGDAKFQKKCLAKMEAVGKEGRTVLFVSHNMAAIQSLCPRACLLESGRLIQIGASDEVVSAYFGAVFSTSGDRELSERRDRVGGSSLRLISFDVVDSDGESMTDIPCGKRASIEIKFQVFSNSISNLRFGISLIDKGNGRYVTELNSYYGSKEIYSCEQGVHKFAFIVNRMPLAPGQYNLNFIVTSGLEVLDWIKDASQLRVSDGLFYESEQMPLPGSYPVFFTEFKCYLGEEEKLNRQDIS